MGYEFDNERPIYIQLVESLKQDIVSGKIKTGEKLPSVRDLAKEAKVNPNTMQKALVELEKEGLIFTERTNGKYVTENNKDIEKTKNEFARTLTEKYIKDMQDIGIDKENIMSYLKGEKWYEFSRV